MPKKGLGRGFDSLIPTDLLDDTFDPTAQQDGKVSELTELPLSSIHPNPDQPRRTFDEEALEELARSVKEHGVLQPIIIVPDQAGGYQIVAGERRYRASQKAGLSKIPVIIRTLTDQNQLEISLIENIQRRDLNTVETATAYAKLRDQFNMTHEQIGQRVHKSTSAVINKIRLLRLPKEVLVAIAEGELTEGQARPLIGQSDDVILRVVPRIIQEEWSSRRVEQYIVNLKNAGDDTRQAKDESSKAYDGVVAKLKQRLGAPVSIQTNAKGAGKIVIRFASTDEFDRIKKTLGEE